jgi:hypothetical protein
VVNRVFESLLKVSHECVVLSERCKFE